MRAKAILLCAFLLTSITTLLAGTYKQLHAFDFNDYANTPFAGVVFDQSGNLYGVAAYGLDYTDGTIFELSPSPSGWLYQSRFEFDYPPGYYDDFGKEPIGGLAIDEANNVYATNSNGGPEDGCGTVFSLSTASVIHDFSGSDGCDPESNLTYFDGRLWGTTKSGGSQNKGTVFSLDTNGGSFQSNSFFGGNGRQPSGGLNAWGYGVTYAGGGVGKGNIYKLDPQQGLINKHSFGPKWAAGYAPVGDLLAVYIGGVRTMYGTTSAGGAKGGGTVYRLTEVEPNSDRWTLTVLFAFSQGGPKGWAPKAGLAMDAGGNLYGTTFRGGTTGSDCGTVFKLSPTKWGTWTRTVLHSFDGRFDAEHPEPQGCHPTSGVVLDNAGNLYGTTSEGGPMMGGVVYQIVP
ncbi:MAG TPA: choice-of-anchor tandem repeat GloVer-containing protein [Terriglobales bacterium]|jgi:uncharacterized repeat protein (TIGR03803 family)|nr:choice-of-anchor tandem repeat GloVer-containing protein [Terriglobales bacterium]